MGGAFLTCGLRSSHQPLHNLQCLSGSKIYNAFNPDHSDAIVNCQENLFGTYLTPMRDW